MKNTGGDEGSSSSPNPNDSPLRRHTPGGSSTVTRPVAVVEGRNPIVMGRPGVSAFRPYVRPPQKPRPIQPRPQSWPAPPIAAGPRGIGGGSMFQTRPGLSAFRPYVRPQQNWPAPPAAAGRGSLLQTRPGVSAFRPYVRPSQSWPAPPTAAGPSGIGGSLLQTRPGVSALIRPYVRPSQSWPAPPTAGGPSGIGGSLLQSRLGISALIWPYVRPSQSWPAPPTAAGPRSTGGSMFQARPGLAVAIGGGAGVKEGGIRIGSVPTVRKMNNRAAAGNNNPQQQDGGEQGGAGDQLINCSICGRSFASRRAFLGHMRSHHDSEWTWAHPPPMARVADEFSDLPGVNRPEDVEAVQPEGGDDGNGGGGSKKDGGFDFNNSPPTKG